MARKEDFFTVADFFEINALNYWCNTPCVTKTQRFGYIWEYASCAEPSHRTTVVCEKMKKGLKSGLFLPAGLVFSGFVNDFCFQKTSNL